MKTAKIFKVLNSLVYAIEFFNNGIYKESAYSKTKADAYQYAKKLGYKVENQ